IGIFCLAGAGLTIFSAELVYVFAASTYQDARRVVPLVAFGGVAGGLDYLSVNVLLFDGAGVRYVAVGAGLAALVSIGGNFLLIPSLGLMGAGIAFMLAQIVAALTVGYIGGRIDPVRWRYGRIAAAYLVSAVVAFPCAYLLPGMSVMG